MKRAILIAATCLVATQAKTRFGYYATECTDVNGPSYVMLEMRVPKGKMVTYEPYSRKNDEKVYGKILGIHAASEPKKKAAKPKK